MERERGRFERALWKITGVICVAIGTIGIVVPLLPTVPFLICAAYCFDRGSPRLHDWLVNRSRFGPLINDYLAGRGIPIRTKAITLIILWATISISIFIFMSSFWIRVLLLAVALGVTIHILMLKTLRAGRE